MKQPTARQAKRDDKVQSRRFIEAAREHGADQTGEALERALVKIAPPKGPEKAKDKGDNK